MDIPRRIAVNAVKTLDQRKESLGVGRIRMNLREVFDLKEILDGKRETFHTSFYCKLFNHFTKSEFFNEFDCRSRAVLIYFIQFS